jgi:hypothetical protein
MADQNAPRAEDQIGSKDTIIMQDLPIGARLRLRSGAVAEVTANPRDGAWVFVRHADGTEDMVFCTDVMAVL